MFQSSQIGKKHSMIKNARDNNLLSSDRSSVKFCRNYVGYSQKILKSLDSVSIEFCLKSRLIKGSYQTDFYPCFESVFKTEDLLQNSDFF